MNNKLIQFAFIIFITFIVYIALLEQQKIQINTLNDNGHSDYSHYQANNQRFMTTRFRTSEKSPLKIQALDQAGIALTFDDKNVDEWYSFWLLSYKYGAKATFFVNSFQTLTIDQVHKLKQLQALDNEIGFHTVNHINVLKYLEKNSMDKYLQTEIVPGINLMQENGFIVKSFAYPFGVGSNNTDKELLKFFDHLRYTKYPANETKIKEMEAVFIKKPYRKVITAVGIDNGYYHSIEEIYEGIDRAARNNEIIVLYAHSISNELNKLNISYSKLEMIVKYAFDKGLKFYTIEEV